MDNQRDIYWDSLKFILIFLVVVTHCVQLYKPAGGLNQALFNLLLTILMPVFVFTSGMFSQMKDREKYKKGILRLLETYVVFQTIMVGIKILPALIHDTTTLKSVLAAFLRPHFQLWYLLSLVFWRLMVLFAPEMLTKHNPAIILSACFLISLLGGFVPVGKELSLQRTMTYLPFFFMGYYAKNIDMKKRIAKIPLPLAIGVLASCFLVYYFFLNYNLSFILCGYSTYYGIDGFTPLALCLARGLLLITATITGLMLMRLTPTKATFFSQWGKVTLFIFVYHYFFIQITRYAILHNILPQNEWLLIILGVFITMALVILSRIQFLNVLMNPISHLVGRNVK